MKCGQEVTVKNLNVQGFIVGVVNTPKDKLYRVGYWNDGYKVTEFFNFELGESRKKMGFVDEEK